MEVQTKRTDSVFEKLVLERLMSAGYPMGVTGRGTLVDRGMQSFAAVTMLVLALSGLAMPAAYAGEGQPRPA